MFTSLPRTSEEFAVLSWAQIGTGIVSYYIALFFAGDVATVDDAMVELERPC